MAHLRRLVAGVVAIGIVGGGAVLVAPSASAANLGAFSTNGLAFTSVSITGEVGDTFTLTNNGTGGNDASLQNATGTAAEGATNCNVPGGIPSCPVLVGSGVHTFTITQTGQLQVWGAGLMYQVLGTITVTSANASAGASVAASVPKILPAPVIQQFGRPANGTCADVAPDTLNWSGVASGGWGESYAQWMNEGQGGFVCTRTLVYAVATDSWSVQ